MAEDERRRPERAPGERELWLGELLDAAAEQYEPDSERLKAMVTARIAQRSEDAGPRPRRSRRPRRRRGLGLIGRLGLAGIPAGVALATVGAAAALAVGATATIAVTSSHPGHTVTVASPSGTPDRGGSPSQTTDASSSPTATAATPSTTLSATSGPSSHTTVSGSPTGGTATSDFVTATPAIDKAGNSDWAQLDLAVDIKNPLTALHVTVKVSKCDGLGSTGSWDSGAIGQFTETTTTDADGSITYEFELVQGDQVSPGTLTFAVQFNHAATGWNVADDTYYVSARTTTSATATSVQGAYRD